MVTSGKPPRIPWLLRRPGPDARALLFCLPYAGSGASSYHAWPRRIDDIEVCPVQFPGREDRLYEPHYETYQRLAAGLVAGLTELLDRPFAIFGHCDSALIALEWAAALREAGGPVPRRVFVSSMFNPAATNLAPILGMDDGALADLLGDMARARGGTFAAEFATMALRVMRADIEAFRRYAPGPPDRYTVPVTVVGWESDDMVPPDRTIGWDAYGAVRRIVLPGGHWSFLDAPAALRSEIVHSGLVREMVER